MRRRWATAMTAFAAFSAASCISRAVDVIPYLPPTSDATLKDLVERVNAYRDLHSLVARVDLTFETVEEAEEGEGRRFRTAQGRMLLQRPDSIRLNVEAPILSADIAEMASNGERFQLLIHPSEYRALIIGTNGVDYEEQTAKLDDDPELAKAGPLKNIRPQHFTGAFLLSPITIFDHAILSEDFAVEPDTRPGAEEDAQVRKSYYTVTAFRRGAEVARVRYWFDRIGGITLRRQQIFDARGRLVSDVRYEDYRSEGGYQIPMHARVERPHDDYTLVVNLRPDGIQPNRELPPRAFEVTPPPEWTDLRRIDLDAPSGPATR